MSVINLKVFTCDENGCNHCTEPITKEYDLRKFGWKKKKGKHYCFDCSTMKNDEKCKLKIGDEVLHHTMGKGFVMSVSGNPSDIRIKIDFSRGGVKELLWHFSRTRMQKI